MTDHTQRTCDNCGEPVGDHVQTALDADLCNRPGCFQAEVKRRERCHLDAAAAALRDLTAQGGES